jgi:hypothetical protein
VTRPATPARQRRLLASQARPAVDLRPLLAPALDQKTRPVCVAVTLTAAHEALRAQEATAAPEALSPEPLWGYAVSTGAAGPDGATLASGCDGLAVVGQPPLSEWPFDQTLGVGTQSPPAAAGPPPWRTANGAELRLAHDGIENAVENTLAAGQPVLLAVEATREFRLPPRSGEIALAPLNTPLGEGHAVLAVGAATHPSRGRQLLIRNSWGPRWGAGGYGWLQLSWIAAFGIAWATVSP